MTLSYHSTYKNIIEDKRGIKFYLNIALIIIDI